MKICTGIMNIYLLFLLLFFVVPVIALAQQKKVFAHYMVCNRSYGGGTVDGYKKDIQDAQNIGVDGFALNIGGWDANYKINTERLFQAAKELNTGFTLFFSPDKCCGLSDNNILDMINKYINHPNYYKYKNRPFLSAWAGGGLPAKDEWMHNILEPLHKEGYNIYFVPFLFTTDYSELPDYSKFLNNFNSWWKYFINGYFYFGAVGLPGYQDPRLSLLKASESAAKVFHDSGFTYMAPVSPLYWGSKQKSAGRIYYEYNGGEGIDSQWRSIITIQKPEWVELVTWNDWDEGTYFSPIDDINKYWPWALRKDLDYYKTHKGFAELTHFYIQWYKSGTEPSSTNDKIYFFYRTHSKAMVADSDLLGPVRWQAGKVLDDIYVTTILKAPAKLIVQSGNKTYTYKVDKGIVHNRIPFITGKQVFEIKRQSKTIIRSEGEDIIDHNKYFNFNVYSGSDSSKKKY